VRERGRGEMVSEKKRISCYIVERIMFSCTSSVRNNDGWFKKRERE